MYKRQGVPLGGWVFIGLFMFCLTGAQWLSSTNLLRNGVITQGVIVDEQATSCGKQGSGNDFSVQFTDRTGQVHTSIISQCTYGFAASPGNSVTIVYLPDNPTQIAPPDKLMDQAQLSQNSAIFVGLLTLILLPFWIRKRLRKSKHLDQQEQTHRPLSDFKGTPLFRD